MPLIKLTEEYKLLELAIHDWESMPAAGSSYASQVQKEVSTPLHSLLEYQSMKGKHSSTPIIKVSNRSGKHTSMVIRKLLKQGGKYSSIFRINSLNVQYI